MSFAEFILANLEPILVEWEQFAGTIPAARQMARKRLRDHAELMLRVIAEDMCSSQSGAEQQSKSREIYTEQADTASADDTASQAHASERLDDGFPIDALVAEYRALRASVIRLWTKQMRSADEATLYEMTRFNEAIDQAIGEGVGRYSARVEHSREMFLGILGHDLRTPLAAVLLSARYLLHSDRTLEKEQMKAALRIERSGLRMKRMIADLLDAARVRLGGHFPINRETTDAASLCQSAADESRSAHPDRAITVAASGELSAYWDSERVMQALSNLIENALKHGSADRPVDVSARGDAHQVVISIRNWGAVICKEDQELIFEPLTQATQSPASDSARDGLGLGLYIAREISRAHGGSIRVSSDERDGTIFSVTLPRGRALEPV